jgi:hypothetical protein
MGRLKEQYYEVQEYPGWHEIEAGALLGLPETGSTRHMSLEPLAALPVGTAIASEIWVTSEGGATVTLKQLAFGSSDESLPPLLGLTVPYLAPGSTLLLGHSKVSSAHRRKVVPDWQPLLEGRRNPGPRDRELEENLKLPKPASAWPWNLKQALATIAAAGGGCLCLTVKHVARNARVERTITELREVLVAASYALPDDRTLLAGQLNCKAMLEHPSLFSFDVSVSTASECDTVRNLVAIALFGTLAADDVCGAEDLRLLSGSKAIPDRIVPLSDDISGLIATRSLGGAADTTKWCLGTIGAGIEVSLSENDRARHLYVIGATGTGKSTLLKSLIMQDIEAGEGVVVLDPHGDLAEDVLTAVPAHRTGDLIYADATDLDGRFAVDLLPSSPDSLSFEIAADMLVSIFKSTMYSSTPEGFGPIFESYFRNALGLLLFAAPIERNLANFNRVFDDPTFRRDLLQACTVSSICAFWRSAGRASGEPSLENITPYITSKLTRFVASRHARVMFPVAEKCLSFDAIMDEGKILILRCPKGALGEGLTELAMSACLMKIRAAAMARAGCRNRRPVRVYIDEFQNCKGDSLQSLLAEGRKFGISLVLANQSLGQIGGTTNQSIGAATLANVGNLVSFRVGAVDAIKLSPWFDTPDRWRDLCQLPDFTMNARLLDHGRPANFLGIASFAFPKGKRPNQGASQAHGKRHQTLDPATTIASNRDNARWAEGGE